MDDHMLRCLAEWIATEAGIPGKGPNAGDKWRIKAYLDWISMKRKPIAAVPGLREAVRKAWRECGD